MFRGICYICTAFPKPNLKVSNVKSSKHINLVMTARFNILHIYLVYSGVHRPSTVFIVIVWFYKNIQ